jgi:hypothetical protein
MKKVTAPQVATPKEAAKKELPEAVQETLGDLAGAAREGLLALSVGVGLGVVHELMAAEVEEVCGPKGKRDPDRKATRWSGERGSLTLGGRRMAVERPRMRTPDRKEEVPLAAYEHFADRDPLTDLVFERIVSGVSCRGYVRTNEPVGSEVEEEASATSKSAISRAFVEKTRTALEELMSRCLEDVRLAAMMIDGVQIGARTHVVALGITTQGVKVPLGLWEGLDRERHRGDQPARRPPQPRSGPRAGDPLRDRRCQGTCQGDPRRLRRALAGAALPSP